MKTSEIVILKLIGIGATILYGLSFLWVTLLYLYGGIFSPLSELGLKKSIYFESFVVFISFIGFGLIFLRFKGSTFWKLLFQDIILIVISVPFLAVAFDIFDNEFGENGISDIVYACMFLLTIIAINVNDWLKTRKASR